MSLETFRAALQWAPRMRTPMGNIPSLNIGGGEPTLHPFLFQMIDEAVEFSSSHKLGRPWMVTNGKIKEHALMLAKIAKSGAIRCGLSRDRWHEEIAPEVVMAFSESVFNHSKNSKSSSSNGDGRFIQNIGSPILSGRARHMASSEPLRACCNGCSRPWVYPDGSVKQCACDDSKVIGSVHTSFFPMNREWMCWCGRPSPNRLMGHLNPETHPGLV